MKRVILVDFENIQKLDFEHIDTTNTDILIFVGRSQTKIPFQLVEKAQGFGERLKWLKIAGDGKNNLDFHLAFELGRLVEQWNNQVELIILSKDSGYDSLIRYVNDIGVQTKRIANPAELSDSTKQLPTSNFTGTIVANLRKINVQKLPRTRTTLKKHIASLLRDKANSAEIDLIIEEMFVKGLLTLTNNRLKYSMDPAES
ncbi:MAG TPA: PIN domain-containing protein [Syntrophorhabdaceae bacterium]|nr:PIN domain-containing protein [Syntrophorhabdaceae bacterium]